MIRPLSLLKFVPSVAILVLLGMLPTFASRVKRTENLIRVSPQFLISEIVKQVPPDKCSRTEGYFRTCFQMSETQCRTHLAGAFQQAGKEIFAGKWDQRIELSLSANYFAQEIGTRAGSLFEERHRSLKKNLDDCYRVGAFPE